MNLRNEILSSLNFETLDKRVEQFLDKTISALEEQKVTITDYTKMILSMLVAQLVLYYKACDSALQSDKVSSEDAYKRKAKMPEISIMQKSHDQILHLLDKIALSPLSSAKIKKLNSTDGDETAQEYLDALING